MEIDADHLSVAVRNRLEGVMNAPNYNGVRISCSMSPPDHVVVRSLQDEVAQWLQEGGYSRSMDVAAVQADQYAKEFAQFWFDSVMDFCKAQFRQQILADVAAEKIKTLNFCDEIEVMLGFIVAFSREFPLNAQMDTLLYPACSNIKPDDIYQARKQLTRDPFTVDGKQLYLSFFEGMRRGVDEWMQMLTRHKPNRCKKRICLWPMR